MFENTVKVSLDDEGVLRIFDIKNKTYSFEGPITMLHSEINKLIETILGIQIYGISKLIFEKGWGKIKKTTTKTIGYNEL